MAFQFYIILIGLIAYTLNVVLLECSHKCIDSWVLNVISSSYDTYV